ncbi:hypothetical protein R1flu_005232 [Riccia fluitans]|uniref:Uncharacterized protein n=1 Tax=Riccia fluitans TaxID=41844 RepID=A0ABD1YSK8_9MARC
MAAAVGTIYAHSLSFNPVKAKLGRDECDMKLLGVSELADGTLNFSFGVASEEPSFSGNNTLDTSMAAVQAPVASVQLPLRLPSAFQKKSPISVSTRRREHLGSSRDSLPKEDELPKPAVISGVFHHPEIKKENGLVLERVDKSIFDEAVSSQSSTSSRKTPGHTLPTRMKSKFVKQSPVPSTSGAIRAAVDVSAKSSVVRVEDNISAPKKISSEVTKSEALIHTRGNLDVDVSVQTGIVNAEPAVREHGDTQTSAKPISGAIFSEDSDTDSATNAGDSQTFGGLSIQGLSVSISSRESVEKAGVKRGREGAFVTIVRPNSVPREYNGKVSGAKSETWSTLPSSVF